MLWTINIHDQVLLAECESENHLRERLVDSLGHRAQQLDIRPAAGADMLTHLSDYEVIINFSHQNAADGSFKAALASDRSSPSPLSFQLFADPAA